MVCDRIRYTRTTANLKICFFLTIEIVDSWINRRKLFCSKTEISSTFFGVCLKRSFGWSIGQTNNNAEHSSGHWWGPNQRTLKPNHRHHYHHHHLQVKAITGGGHWRTDYGGTTCCTTVQQLHCLPFCNQQKGYYHDEQGSINASYYNWMLSIPTSDLSEKGRYFHTNPPSTFPPKKSKIFHFYSTILSMDANWLTNY